MPIPRRHLPNALTVLRLVLAAAFFAALNAYRYPDEGILWGNVAIALFIVGALTDAFDGALARRWDAGSTFGRLMDPFCDKVLVLGAFIYLAGPRFVVPAWVEDDSFFTMATGVYPWMVVLILVRELLVTGVRGLAESLGVNFGAMWSGKAKMILQSITVPVVLFLAIDVRTAEREWAMIACHAFVYATLLVTLWSGVPYVFALRRIPGAAEAVGKEPRPVRAAAGKRS
jgi:phosphatidylglycerophosphate synthase